jgi:hypothetical protein
VEVPINRIHDRTVLPATSLRAFRKYFLIPAIFLASLIVYSVSFNHFAVLSEKSVLAQADSVYFQILIQDFHLSKKYGNEYTIKGRSDYDRAQKHKIHHVLYAIFASALYAMLSSVFRVVGIGSGQALYTVNAVIGCINLALLYLLLRHFNSRYRSVALYLVMYAFSLSTWIYCSLPESWPFSAALTLAFLCLFYIRRQNYLLLAVLAGVFMLNNIMLGFLSMFLIVGFLNDSRDVVSAVKKIVLSLAVTLSTWFVCLSGLSYFDSSLSPWNVIRYSAWHRNVIISAPSVFDLYTWKAVLSNLLINTVVSNQSDPSVPTEAVINTFKQSYLGGFTTIVFGLLLLSVCVNVALFLKRQISTGRGWRVLVENYEFHLMLYCAGWVVICSVVMATASFMYSAVVLPVYMMIICRFVNEEKPYLNVLVHSSAILIVLNNAVQVLKFRGALGLLS